MNIKDIILIQPGDIISVHNNNWKKGGRLTFEVVFITLAIYKRFCFCLDKEGIEQQILNEDIISLVKKMEDICEDCIVSMVCSKCIQAPRCSYERLKNETINTT